MGVDLRHGGNCDAVAARLNCRPSQLLDASASLAPWTPRFSGIPRAAIRDYPDRGQTALRQAMAGLHGLDPDTVLPGNGAAELFTWAARDAANAGPSALLAPGFADYRRALQCWNAPWIDVPLALRWDHAGPLEHPSLPAPVAWLCNPHNPTGQLWSRTSLEPLLATHGLVICDEAFLPLVPDGERQSMIPLVEHHPNLVVIRSLTKLFAIAGLRLGYALASPERLQRWSGWRDPWSVNGLALAAGSAVMADGAALERWLRRVHHWVQCEGPWLQYRLDALPGLTAYPSSANYLLVEAGQSLLAVREAVARRGVLLRDCRSFEGLGECWLRIGLQSRSGNRRIVRALQMSLDDHPLN